MIKVKFECDDAGNHDCNITELSRVKVLDFEDSIDALHFIGECTSCLSTNIRTEAPELFIHIDINDLDTDVIPLDESNMNISNIFKQIIIY